MRATHPDRSWIADFYQQLDPERVLAALQRVDSQSSGAVTSTTLWSRKPGEENLRGAESGIFAPEIFDGDRGRFGHVETAGVLHPAAFTTLEEELGLTSPQIEAIARGDMALRASTAVVADDFEEGDLTGPLAFAKALREKVPDHPHLPLCTVTKIPVPPISTRPPRPGRRPELVDPWIGPENEAWQVLVFHAKRQLRLQELGAPEVIVGAETFLLQQAFDEAFMLTSSSFSWLMPALTRGIDTEVKALAFAGDRRLLVQRGDGVHLVALDGRELRSFEPAGCTLRGVVDERYAVFQEIVEGGQHPSVSTDDGLWPSWFAHVDAEGCTRFVDPILSVSVLDLKTGKYLVDRPSWLSSAFPENHEPEELYFDDRPLFVGGDRPSAMSYSHDLRFVCVGDDSEMHILELESGRSAAVAAHVSRASHQLELATSTFRELDPDLDVEATPGGSAISFADGTWTLVNPDGILTDHLGRNPVQLVPSPFASAFSPAGSHLAVTCLRPDDSVEVVVLDLKARAVVARFSSS